MVHAPEAAAIGPLLDGRYRIIRQIGQGGMGAVFIGEDTRLKRRCALKVLHAGLAADRTNVERFLREAQIIAQLDHPNIVDIYSVGEDPSGLVFFAMELLQGEDLEARLRRLDAPPGAHEVCTWGLEIARAMAAVHDAGLIHRDLKPSNVFLARTRDGEETCKLLDFGIARGERTSDLTGTGVALGTPSYMAPEQLCNDDVDRRADIYSFGVLLFRMLTGRVPFLGEPIQVAIQHRDVTPPPPSRVAPEAGVPAALDAVVLKAMAKRPDERYASMRAIEAALAEVRDGVIPAPPSGPSPRRPIRSRSVEIEICLSTGPQASLSPAPARTQGDATPASLSPPTVPTLATSTMSVATRRHAIAALILGALSIVVLKLLVSGRSVAPEPAETPTEPPAAPAAEPEPKAPGPVQAVVVTPPPPVEVPPGPRAEPRRRPSLAPSPRKPTNAPSAHRVVDPLEQIARKAMKCRRKFDAVGGEQIIIDYALGGDGKVTRSIALTEGELGRCLATAVASTEFGSGAPALGLKLPL